MHNPDRKPISQVRKFDIIPVRADLNKSLSCLLITIRSDIIYSHIRGPVNFLISNLIKKIIGLSSDLSFFISAILRRLPVKIEIFIF